MSNINQAHAREVWREGAAVIRAQHQRIQELEEKLAQYVRRERAETIVNLMEAKGLSDDALTFQEKVAAVLSTTTDLDVLEKAVQLSAPNHSFSFAHLAGDGPAVPEDEVDGTGRYHGGYNSHLEEFLLNG